jgi:hypothetical protein
LLHGEWDIQHPETVDILDHLGVGTTEQQFEEFHFEEWAMEQQFGGLLGKIF